VALRRLDRVEKCHVRKVAGLLALVLSLRFNHEEFCEELYTRRKTLSLTIFGGSQTAFFSAG
jgi:hypothetical protein